MSFIYFSCLFWLELSVLCWTEVMRVGTLTLFLILGKLSVFSLFSRVLWVFIDGLYFVEVIFSVPHLLSVLSWIGFEFVRCFFCMCWDECVAFILYSVNIMNQIKYAELCLLPRDNPTWSCCIISLCTVGFGLLVFCWGFFKIYSYWGY
jgi:hypothetical protein